MVFLLVKLLNEQSELFSCSKENNFTTSLQRTNILENGWALADMRYRVFLLFFPEY
jgi:hypothetical protein